MSADAAALPPVAGRGARSPRKRYRNGLDEHGLPEPVPTTVEAMLEQYDELLWSLALPAYRRTAWRAEPEDMYSIAQVAAWLAFTTYSPDRGRTLMSWVRHKVGFALHDEVRRLTRMRRARGAFRNSQLEISPVDDPEMQLTDDRSDPELGLEHSILRADLRALLPEREAEVLVSIYIEREPWLDVARRLGCSRAQATHAHQRAIKRLRREFAA